MQLNRHFALKYNMKGKEETNMNIFYFFLVSKCHFKLIKQKTNPTNIYIIFLFRVLFLFMKIFKIYDNFK